MTRRTLLYIVAAATALTLIGASLIVLIPACAALGVILSIREERKRREA